MPQNLLSVNIYCIPLGYYAALISKSGRLISPDYNFTLAEYCVNFWYFLEGDRSTQLKIQKVMTASDSVIVGIPTTVWADIAEPDVKGQWMHAKASITGLSLGDYNVSNGNGIYLSGSKREISGRYRYKNTRLLSDFEASFYLLSPKTDNHDCIHTSIF